MKWTAESLREQVVNLPNCRGDEEKFKRLWTRPVTDFGLKFYMPTPDLPYHQWNEGMWAGMETHAIWTGFIDFSTQTDVRLDVLDWYLNDPIAESENFDTDGWMMNDAPVVIALPNGSYVIKDGNHRIISAMLMGIEFLHAYVMKGK